jgi:hypothetical protein
MTVPIRDLRSYFDREIDVAGPISIRVQHAAKQGNTSHPSQKYGSLLRGRRVP